jgi:hypothetical protein
MITTHQYLAKYPISPESKTLIVGTIHPHDHGNFKIPFFYGSKTSIWSILSDAFPDDLIKPITLRGVLNFLEKHKISVSDTIIECERVNPTALDKDLIPLLLNTQMIDEIKNSNINEILFTSGFQKNNAFRLFYVDILGRNITPEIRNSREVILEKEVFGRKMKLILLYSPSGSSNVGLSKSKLYLENNLKYINSDRPVYDFKVDYYRDKFKLNNY